MRAFVTGATGFIGGRLARALLADGWEVTALARTPSKAAQLAALGATLVAGDVTDRAVLDPAIRGHDAVFHFAAMYAFGPSDRAVMERTNVEGTRLVMRAASDAGVGRVVYCSSSTVLGRDAAGGLIDESTRHTGSVASFYEQTKLEAYRIAHREAAPVTVMPTAVYGPGDTSLMGTMVRLWATGKLLAAPFLDVGVSFVHVDDVARGSIAAAERGSGGQDYLLAGDNETIGGALRRAGAVLGLRPPLVKVPAGRVRAALPVVAPMMGYKPGALREAMATLSSDLRYSSEKARRELGYTFRRVEDGFADCFAAIKAGG